MGGLDLVIEIDANVRASSLACVHIHVASVLAPTHCLQLVEVPMAIWAFGSGTNHTLAVDSHRKQL